MARIRNLQVKDRVMTSEAFRRLALSFPGTEQKPHFDRVGFKVSGKRMFATYLEEENTANIFLSVTEQQLFCKISPQFIYPVPNKWGEKGATTFVITEIPMEIMREALLSGYEEVLGKNKHRNRDQTQI